jgi:trimeric autotransporter adhesin
VGFSATFAVHKFNMKKLYFVALAFSFSLLATAQITLTGTSYTQNFDGIGTALPNGWSIRSGASVGSLGTTNALLNPVPTATQNLWANFNSGFKNYASTDGLSSTADSATQVNYADRALGVRQTGTLGDPGASFVMQLANTTGFNSFSMSFKLYSLDASSARVTAWVVDYGTGVSPSTFTTLTTVPASLTTGGATFKKDSVTVNFGSLINNLPDNVWIRISALVASTGSGNRPSSAIDDVQLNYAVGATDNLPPLATTLLPANGATNVAANAVPKITFNETVIKGVGNIIINNVTDNAQTNIDVNSANVTILGSTVTIGGYSFLTNKNYQITIPAGAFKDLANNNFAGLTGTNWAFAVGNVFSLYEFEGCTTVGGGLLPDGWSQWSSVGASQFWGCTTFGQTGNAVQMNGFQSTVPTGAVDNEDWLISPAVLANTPTPSCSTHYKITFDSRSKFVGPGLKLLYSTNYTVGTDPNTATWIEIPCVFPSVNSDVWFKTIAYLPAICSGNIKFAIKYNSSAILGASRWTFDNFGLETTVINANFTSLQTTPEFLDFYLQAANTNSKFKSFQFARYAAGGTLPQFNQVQAPANFKIARDSLGIYQDTINFEPINIAKTVYVRYQPTATNASNTGIVKVQNDNLAFVTGNSYPFSQTLNVVNWNILWFGSTAQGPTDDAVQATNVKRILDSLNADIYAFQEVVDTARFGTMIRGLANGPYNFVVSDFSSGAADPTSPNWASAQKLAYAYKASMFSNVSARGMLKNSAGAANTNWAAGRYPHLLKADVLLNGATKTIHFINMHAKSGPDPSDYAQRKNGFKELKDTLDANYSTANIILLGDYNDDFKKTICSACATTISSVDDIIKDSTDGDSYRPVTLHLSNQNLPSTVGNSGLIDNVIFSNELASSYVPFSSERYENVLNIIPGYGSANTSDHYPIRTRYFYNTVTATNDLTLTKEKLNIYPNPINDWMTLQNNKKAKNTTIQLVNLLGVVVQEWNFKNTLANQTFALSLKGYAKGNYFIKLVNDNTLTVGKIILQ